MNALLKVGLRNQAIYIPDSALTKEQKTLTATTCQLVACLAKSGYHVSEHLLDTLKITAPGYQAEIFKAVEDVLGLKKNWAPLVKGWDIPTGESVADHIITFFANLFQSSGTRLPCGHIIPAGTFPLDRYNGCPFCGTPFQFGAIEHFKQGSKVKLLELWTTTDASAYLSDLLTSKTALDATQIDSLKILLSHLPLPGVEIQMKETIMVVITILVDQGRGEEAQALFTSPTDILRYLWYRQTGFLQIIEPKTIINRVSKNNKNLHACLDRSASAKILSKASLKLKYNRKECLMVAKWLNNLDLDAAMICEMMHPKRGMWVRFIRALRLAEYSKRQGFEKLKAIADRFYRQDYEVWQGKVEQYRLRYDVEKTMYILKQRPGMFARSLFANMLWFGSEITTEAFAHIIDRIPARLVFTLNMYAENYFDKKSERMIKPLGGVSKRIQGNVLLSLYDDEQLDAMKSAIGQLCMLAMKKRFSVISTTSKTIYIDPSLFCIPVSIGDRSETIQDTYHALMGTRFPVEGSTVRVFMQWGYGLPAQHLDMDLSCHIGYDGRSEICSFSSLVATGCKHSGDIRSIPHKIGTAEYINIDLDVLQSAGARYVTFTCNAYSNGSITPNLVLGWMNSKYPMQISEKTGVAYDPSCVQHQARVEASLHKGLVFGVLDIRQKEIIWLEMPFSGQLVQNLDAQSIEVLIKKLEGKLNIGQLLMIKAEAQNLEVVNVIDADEVYTKEWAANSAGVTKLFVD
jgi:hypothetical protein